MTDPDIEQDNKTGYPSKSLRVIHILLISSATVFALGFAALKLSREEPLGGVASLLVGIGFSVYLRSFI
ncbi:MAG: hypothetical protein VX496_02125, partial [Planctomycetota bacterium]|nr:hypothetical protein [Planctomycetota bacterium]